MAAIVITNGYFELDSNDLSTYATSIEISADVEEITTTTMGNSWTTRVGGLKSGSVTVNFNQDFAVGLLDDLMWAMLGTVVAFEARPDAGAVSTSNPSYSGNVLVSSWNPISASVGELGTVSVTFQVTGAVTRATA